MHFLVAEVQQRRLDGLQRAAHVCLDHDVEGFLLARRHALEHVVELRRLLPLQLAVACLVLTVLGHFARPLLAFDHRKQVTGIRRAIEAQDLHRNTRSGFGDVLAVFIQHGAHAAILQPGQHNVALAQGAALDQQRSHRAAAFIQARLNHDALCGYVARCLQLKHFGLQQDGVQQVINAVAGVCRHFDKLGITAPVLGNHLAGRQFTLDAVGVGALLIHLVDGDNQGHLGSLGVLHGFFGLWHDTVIGGHHQNDDIRALRTAGAHGGKGRVPGGVEEGDHAVARFHVVGADVLGDTTRLTGSHLRLANVVEQ